MSAEDAIKQAVNGVNEAAEELEVRIPKLDVHRKKTEKSVQFGELLQKEVKIAAKRLAPFFSSKVREDRQKLKDLNRELNATLCAGFLNAAEVSYGHLLEVINLLPKLQRRVRILNSRLTTSITAHLQELISLKRTDGEDGVAFYEPTLYLPEEVRNLCQLILEYAGLSAHRSQRADRPPEKREEDIEEVVRTRPENPTVTASHLGVSVDEEAVTVIHDETSNMLRRKIQQLEIELETMKVAYSEVEMHYKEKSAEVMDLTYARESLEKDAADRSVQHAVHMKIVEDASARMAQALQDFAQDVKSEWTYDCALTPCIDNEVGGDVFHVDLKISQNVVARMQELEYVMDTSIKERLRFIEMEWNERSKEYQDEIERLHTLVSGKEEKPIEEKPICVAEMLQEDMGADVSGIEGKFNRILAEKERIIRTLQSQLKELNGELDKSKASLVEERKKMRVKMEVLERDNMLLEQKDAHILRLEDEAVALGMTIVELREEIKRLESAIRRMQHQVALLGQEGNSEVASLITEIMESSGVFPDAPNRRKKVWDRLYVDFFLRMERHERVRAARLLAVTALHRLAHEIYKEVAIVTSPPRYTRPVKPKRTRSASQSQRTMAASQPPPKGEEDLTKIVAKMGHSAEFVPCYLPLMPALNVQKQSGFPRTFSLPSIT